MLVSKNPYVVEARQNLTSKNPHLALKTDEKFTQTYRLNSLIFIVEKYGKKLLFGFLSQNTNRIQANRFCSIGHNAFLLCFVLWFLLLFGGRFGDKGKNFGFKDCAVNDAVVWVVVAIVGSGVSHHEVAAIDCLVYLM